MILGRSRLGDTVAVAVGVVPVLIVVIQKVIVTDHMGSGSAFGDNDHQDEDERSVGA